MSIPSDKSNLAGSAYTTQRVEKQEPREVRKGTYKKHTVKTNIQSERLKGQISSHRTGKLEKNVTQENKPPHPKVMKQIQESRADLKTVGHQEFEIQASLKRKELETQMKNSKSENIDHLTKTRLEAQTEAEKSKKRLANIEGIIDAQNKELLDLSPEELDQEVVKKQKEVRELKKGVQKKREFIEVNIQWKNNITDKLKDSSQLSQKDIDSYKKGIQGIEERNNELTEGITKTTEDIENLQDDIFQINKLKRLRKEEKTLEVKAKQDMDIYLEVEKQVKMARAKQTHSS